MDVVSLILDRSTLKSASVTGSGAAAGLQIDSKRDVRLSTARPSAFLAERADVGSVTVRAGRSIGLKERMVPRGLAFGTQITAAPNGNDGNVTLNAGRLVNLRTHW